MRRGCNKCRGMELEKERYRFEILDVQFHDYDVMIKKM